MDGRTDGYFVELLNNWALSQFFADRFGKPDPSLRRDYDMSVKLHMTSVCYVHTQRFLLETLAFCQHFLQLQNLLGQMRAASAGRKVCRFAGRTWRHVAKGD